MSGMGFSLSVQQSGRGLSDSRQSMTPQSFIILYLHVKASEHDICMTGLWLASIASRRQPRGTLVYKADVRYRSMEEACMISLTYPASVLEWRSDV